MWVRAIMIVMALLIISVMIFLMIKKKSSSTISLIWMAIAFAVLILAFFPQILNSLSRLWGIDYPPALVFVAGIAGLLIISFYLSSEITVAQNKIRELTIHISLLNDEMHQLRKEQNRMRQGDQETEASQENE